MKRILFLLTLIPLIATAQNDPWGISLKQFGAKASWYKTEAEANGNFNQSNYSFGPNGRLQLSFLDFFVYDDQRFRLVDVIGFEASLGYQKSKTFRNDQYYHEEFVTKKLWYDAGVDLGILLKIRVIPKLDLGVKYMYLSQVNSAFNFTESHSAYGNAMNWSFSARYGKFYADLNLIKGQKGYPKKINVFDLKYRFKEKGSWASYAGVQIGIGKTKISNYGADFISTYSRNWIQFSIGKMTNF